MWDQYIEKDNRIIRPLDGSEFILNCFYINVADVFPKFSIEEFKKNAQEELSKIEIFNIATKTIDKHTFYIKKPFQVHVEEVEWNEDEEVDTLLKEQREMPVSYKREFDENGEVLVCYSFKICQLKNDQTKLTFSAVHALCDGRTIFDLFNLVRKVIKGEKLEKMDTPLCPFGQKENFHDVDKFFARGPPRLFTDIEKANLLPPLSEPFDNVVVHYTYDYPPISKFCKENKVGVQALLMAAFTRATRRFHNFPKEKPLWCHVPSDTRASSLATEEYKNRKYFCNAGLFYVKVIGQDSLMEDIQHCNSQLRECQKKNEDVVQLVTFGQLINKESLQFIPMVFLPGFHTHAVVTASHIGKVNGNSPLFYFTSMPRFGQYEFLNYVYHTDDKLYLSNFKPKNFDKTYLKYIQEEIESVFKL